MYYHHKSVALYISSMNSESNTPKLWSYDVNSFYALNRQFLHCHNPTQDSQSIIRANMNYPTPDIKKRKKKSVHFPCDYSALSLSHSVS